MADRPGQPTASSSGGGPGATPAKKPRVLPPMPASAAAGSAPPVTPEKQAPQRAGAKSPTDAHPDAKTGQRSATEQTMPIPRIRPGQARPAQGQPATAKAQPGKAQPAKTQPGKAQPGRTQPAPAGPGSAGAPTRPQPAAGGEAVVRAAVAQPKAPPAVSTRPAAATSAPGRKPRRARLRLTRIDPWSVMKTAFLLSIAFGVVTIVSVMMVWGVLGAAGLWDSINTTVTDVVGGEDSAGFDIKEYVGLSRVLGFTTLVAVVDVILLTAIATLVAFLYNMAAALLGGIEVTLAEDQA